MVIRNFLLFFLLSALIAVAPAKAFSLSQSDIYVSSDKLEQSDTLLVIVKNENILPSGKLGPVKLHFFRSENNKDWIALSGISSNKTPGNYELFIKVHDKADFYRNITVLKRNYSETILGITPDLLQKGFTTKKILNNIKSENQDLLRSINFISKNVYSPKPFSYPLDEIKMTGEFGDIRKSGNSAAQHLGTDFKAPLNTPIYAINDGIVVLEKKYVNYGNTLIINHGLGVYSLYLHLSSFVAGPGQLVKQGELIALSGSTGYSTGPHLHLSVKVRGANVDPLKFIEASKLINNPN